MYRYLAGFLILLVTACGEISNEQFMMDQPMDLTLPTNIAIVEMEMAQGNVSAAVNYLEYVTIVVTANGWRAYNVYGLAVDRDKAIVLYNNSIGSL